MALSLLDSELSTGLAPSLLSITGLTATEFSCDDKEELEIVGNFVVSPPNLKLEVLEVDTSVTVDTIFTASASLASLLFSFSSSDSDSSNASAIMALTLFSLIFLSWFISSGLDKRGFWLSSSDVLWGGAGEFLISSDIAGKTILGGPDTSP